MVSYTCNAAFREVERDQACASPGCSGGDVARDSRPAFTTPWKRVMEKEPKVLIGDPRAGGSRDEMVPSVGEAWKWIGWFSLVLAVVGFADWMLTWYPFHFGSAEWEFGTITATFSGLPLITMGFAGLLGAAMARGVRWQVVVVGVVVLVWLLWVAGALALFLLDVPVALKSVQGAARVGVIKAIVKTTFLGVVFSATYAVAGIGALRYARSRSREKGGT